MKRRDILKMFGVGLPVISGIGSAGVIGWLAKLLQPKAPGISFNGKMISSAPLGFEVPAPFRLYDVAGQTIFPMYDKNYSLSSGRVMFLFASDEDIKHLGERGLNLVTPKSDGIKLVSSGYASCRTDSRYAAIPIKPGMADGEIQSLLLRTCEILKEFRKLSTGSCMRTVEVA